MGKTNIVAGLEIGRTKLRMVAGEVSDSEFNLLCASEVNCLDGIKNGIVINLDKVTEAITALLEDAHQKIDRKISSVFVNIGGINIKQEIVNSVITLPQRGCEITKRNIDSLVESCRIVSVPLDRHLLYIMPVEYIVDGQDEIRDPVGLCGARLEAKILIITAPFNHVQNLTKAVNYSGLEIGEIALTPLANAVSVLTEEERKKGALLIDFKTDMTELAVITNGSLAFFESLPIGQESVTNEMSSRLKIPYEFAQELKIKYGFLEGAQQDGRNNETIPMEWMGVRQNILRRDLNKIIYDQSEAIFTAVSEKLKDIKNFSNIIKRGAVITGGAAYMEGFLENAIQRFGFTARLGIIQSRAERPGNEYATPAGLTFLAFNKRLTSRMKPEANFFKKMYQKADAILTEYF